LESGTVVKYRDDAESPVRMASNSPRAGTPLPSLSGHGKTQPALWRRTTVSDPRRRRL